jgi:hypothetical protein
MDKIEQLREIIFSFVSNLHDYDFYALYWLGALIFFSFLLAVLVKKSWLANILVLVGFVSMVFGPFVSYFVIHKYLYGTEMEINYVRQMEFADVLIVRGKFTAQGEEDISECRFHTFVTPPQDGFFEYIQPLLVLNPIARKTETLEIPLQKGESSDFKIKFKEFKHHKELNASDIYIYRECF